MGLYWSIEMDLDAHQKMINGELAPRVTVDQPVDEPKSRSMAVPSYALRKMRT
jgi:hypothetical protein